MPLNTKFTGEKTSISKPFNPFFVHFNKHMNRSFHFNTSVGPKALPSYLEVIDFQEQDVTTAPAPAKQALSS